MHKQQNQWCYADAAAPDFKVLHRIILFAIKISVSVRKFVPPDIAISPITTSHKYCKHLSFVGKNLWLDIKANP